jgi:hypothetical protein
MTTNQNLDFALKRVETLEKRVYQLKLIASGFSIVIGSLFLMGQVAHRDALEVRNSPLRHPNGKIAVSVEVRRRRTQPQALFER